MHNSSHAQEAMADALLLSLVSTGKAGRAGSLVMRAVGLTTDLPNVILLAGKLPAH